ncbi:fructosamine kinase [Luteimicrobium album]|uniref:Fructosamine kinase n=1 Tax=Luteimicrobium album TaxID=1054550 RepID=A0ABQ6I5Y3_9MICO|nr:fructosamine kinase family protein [Luteimicrobium album]GMA26141.1 fructosamine kinase [Luteimicrobium album]
MPDGATFRKARPGAPAGFFGCEAAGLRWLGEARRPAAPGGPTGPRVVGVRGVGEDHLDLERVVPAAPTREAAARFGRDLATLHDAGATAWGSPPPGWWGDAFFGPLDDPLPLATGVWDTWADFWGEARLRPVAGQGAERGALTRADTDALHRLADRAGRWETGEPPARVHGDLWSGNVMWTASGRVDDVEAVLIDPAAHGGHREADLAMLALFGAPHLDVVLAAYDTTRPLARGWRHRVAVHQVYPVAVHAVLFGGGYVGQLRQMLDALLA